MSSHKKRIFLILACFLSIIIVTAIFYIIIKESGRRNLLNQWEDVVPELDDSILAEEPPESEPEIWQAGWVRYHDGIYTYNQEIMTFLLMGIDKKEEMTEVPEGTDGGQADAMFLLVLNPEDKSCQLISINRNTMTDVAVYDQEGGLVDTVKAPLAVQHGFGNGVEQSCEYQVDAVRNLFYNIPIHGYCAINMTTVVTLTDLIGGVEVVALEDVVLGDNSRTVKKGETILLTGSDAYYYVQKRDITVPGSADGRLLRQQQFLDQFVADLKEALKNDIGLPIRLYEAVKEQVITDVTAEEIIFLVSDANGYDFSSGQFRSLAGETVQGEQFEEFHVDEDALYQMIIEVFYQPVTIS